MNVQTQPIGTMPKPVVPKRAKRRKKAGPRWQVRYFKQRGDSTRWPNSVERKPLTYNQAKSIATFLQKAGDFWYINVMRNGKTVWRIDHLGRWRRV